MFKKPRVSLTLSINRNTRVYVLLVVSNSVTMVSVKLFTLSTRAYIHMTTCEQTMPICTVVSTVWGIQRCISISTLVHT